MNKQFIKLVKNMVSGFPDYSQLLEFLRTLLKNRAFIKLLVSALLIITIQPLEADRKSRWKEAAIIVPFARFVLISYAMGIISFLYHLL